MDATQYASLQTLLHQLHTHVTASLHAPPPPAATSAPIVLPPVRATVADSLRGMRAAATSIYADVLTEEERQLAQREWAWKPAEMAVNAADSAEADGADTNSTAVVSSQPAGGMRFHRFSVPLASLLDEFILAARNVRSVTSYHTALISCLLQAQRAQQQAHSTDPSKAAGAAPTGAELQQLSRTFLFTLKQRVDLQRQAARVQGNFARALYAIQHELQLREQRTQRIRQAALAAPSEDDPPIPAADVRSLVSSLVVLREQLSLVEQLNTDDYGNSEPTFTLLQPGTVELSSHTTSDGRDVSEIEDLRGAAATAAFASLPRLSCNTLACERHLVNLSSTAVSACSVVDLYLIQPLLRTDEDRARMAKLRAQVAALPEGIASLHPQSSLAQVLLHGFCIHGKRLTALSDMVYVSPNEVCYFDSADVGTLYARDMDSFRSRLQMMLQAEKISDEHQDAQLWKRPDEVHALMRTEVERHAATPVQTLSLLGRCILRPKFEGPSLVFQDTLPAGAPQMLREQQQELAITFVCTEKVYTLEGDLSAAMAPATSAGAQPMDTSAANGTDAPASTPALALPFTFAYRFLLSHSLLVPFSTARQLFGWNPAASVPASTAAAPATAATLVEDSYYHSCRGHSVPFLLSESERSVHINVFGSRQEYVATLQPEEGFAAAMTEPCVRISSFLCRSLEQLPTLLRACRQLRTFERVYRSVFDSQHPLLLHSSTPAQPPVMSAPVVPLEPTVRALPAKLKFSHRQLLDLDDGRVNGAKTATNGGSAPRADAHATSVIHVQASPPNTLLLRTAHPLTHAPLEIRINVSPEGDGVSVQLQCENGAVPSSAVANQLLRTSASVPLFVHGVLQRVRGRG